MNANEHEESKNSKEQEQTPAQETQAGLVGRIILDDGNVFTYTDPEVFLSAFNSFLDQNPAGFSYEILSDDPQMQERVDEILNAGVHESEPVPKIEGLSVLNYITDPVCMALLLEECCITVNLGASIGNNTIMPKNCAFLDVNNYPGITRFVEENGLAEPYCRYDSPVVKRSGWVEYPLYSFREDVLRASDSEGYAKYESEFLKAFSQIQREMNKQMFGQFIQQM